MKHFSALVVVACAVLCCSPTATSSVQKPELPQVCGVVGLRHSVVSVVPIWVSYNELLVSVLSPFELPGARTILMFDFPGLRMTGLRSAWSEYRPLGSELSLTSEPGFRALSFGVGDDDRIVSATARVELRDDTIDFEFSIVYLDGWVAAGRLINERYSKVIE